MKKACNVCTIISMILAIVGALNWLLVGIFNFDLVSWISFGMAWISTTLYILVGLAGIYLLIWSFMVGWNFDNDDSTESTSGYQSHSFN